MNILILLAALLYDRFIGEQPDKLHPVRAIGIYIGKLWKVRPLKYRSLQFLYGVFIILSGVFLVSALSYSLTFLPPLLFILISIPLLKYAFSLHMLLKTGKEIAEKLEQNDLEAARKMTEWNLVSRDTSQLSESDIASAVIESLAENLTDSLTTPLFCYVVGGLPAAWAARFINTSDAMIAYRDEEHEWGGKFTAWTDSLLHLVPARITGILLCLAAGFTVKNTGNAFSTMFREHGKTDSPNAGWTMSAMAGALNITLAKSGQYSLNGGSEIQSVSKIYEAVTICRNTALFIILFTVILSILIQGGIQWI